jgi:hypothetical protein
MARRRAGGARILHTLRDRKILRARASGGQVARRARAACMTGPVLALNVLL